MTQYSYHTLDTPVEDILWKEKNSKFLGYAYPISGEEEVKVILEQLKKQHATAHHVCYAYQWGVKQPYYRVNDDGEPSNTAGQPIYGQIQSFGLTHVLVAVVRYYGGIKLGVSGLIQAYRTTAQLTLEAGIIIEKHLETAIQLHFEYPLLNKVMRIIKETQAQIVNQQMEMSCSITVNIRSSELTQVLNRIEQLYGLEFQIIESV